MEIIIELTKSFVGAVIVLVPAYWLHKRELKKSEEKLKEKTDELKEVNYKAEVLAKLLDFQVIGEIRDAVDDLFTVTKADRFLILIAMNGVKNFNVVSVVFEQYKNRDYNNNAIGRYHHITIDPPYKSMLTDSEKFGMVEVETDTMPACMLRTFYKLEGVKHAQIRHLFRHEIDASNDLLIYTSLATHKENPFGCEETDFIQSRYDSSIKGAIKKML